MQRDASFGRAEFSIVATKRRELKWKVRDPLIADTSKLTYLSRQFLARSEIRDDAGTKTFLLRAGNKIRAYS